MNNSFFTGQTAHECCDNCIYDEWDDMDLVLPVLERHDIIARHCLRYLTTIKYIQEAEIECTTGLTQRQ